MNTITINKTEWNLTENAPYEVWRQVSENVFSFKEYVGVRNISLQQAVDSGQYMFEATINLNSFSPAEKEKVAEIMCGSMQILMKEPNYKYKLAKAIFYYL